ncbi:hypothetical protein F5Y09DRAFT_342700 [Xylaria sp. FL1042]|nr:hypothetical protein F5Y09DRAFT_342700 [Xylaria sp. FL1042]
MKFLFLLTLFCTSAALAATDLALVPRDPKCPKSDGNKDDQIIAHYKTTGQCFSYIGAGNRDKSLAPCSGPDGYCQKVKKSTSGVEGCKLIIPEGVTLDPSLYFKDEDCNEWYPGQCMCDCDLCQELAQVIIKGLAELDNIICAVMLSAFKTILDIGLEFIPGGQASGAIKAAVQGAKSFYENGEDAASFFGNWIGPACGVPDFNFDIGAVFTPLVNAPDSMSRGPPVGCKRKSGCRPLDPVPDPPTKPDKPNKPKPTDQPKTVTQPKATQQSKTITKHSTKTTTQSTKTAKQSTKTTKTGTTSRSTSSSTPTSTAGAGCAYCGEFDKKTVARDDKYGVMYARTGKTDNSQVCVLPPAGDNSSKRSLSDLVLDQLLPRSLLLERALSDKISTVIIKLGKDEWKYDCFVGKYAPSSDAANIAEITKYWRFKDPGNTQKCSVEVEQVAASQINIGDYQTDHVFEAQTLAHFIKWLTDESPAKIGTTYNKPKAKWVVEAVLGDGPFRIVKPGNTKPGDLSTPNGGEVPVILMAYGFGRSDGVKSVSGGQVVERIPAARGNKNLVLLHENINGAKAIYFKKNKPDSSWSTYNTQEKSRVEVRRGVGPFQYLAASDTAAGDTMWKKWARVSNWIDLVCHEFDQQYPWGSRADEPKNSAGTASLRSLWAHFIDMELDEIETAAAAWARDAKTGFDKKWPKLSAAEKDWRREAFGTNGFATSGRMRFPRPANLPVGASPYGAYGWGDVTLDASDQNPNIGTPVKIT